MPWTGASELGPQFVQEEVLLSEKVGKQPRPSANEGLNNRDLASAQKRGREGPLCPTWTCSAPQQQPSPGATSLSPPARTPAGAASSHNEIAVRPIRAFQLAPVSRAARV